MVFAILLIRRHFFVWREVEIQTESFESLSLMKRTQHFRHPKSRIQFAELGNIGRRNELGFFKLCYRSVDVLQRSSLDN